MIDGHKPSKKRECNNIELDRLEGENGCIKSKKGGKEAAAREESPQAVGCNQLGDWKKKKAKNRGGPK